MIDYKELYKKEKEYTAYINDHISNVDLAFNLYGEDICRVLDVDMHKLKNMLIVHDESKTSGSEFNGYRQYFYPLDGEEKDEDAFEVSWLHHIHKNPHHSEYWIYVDDNREIKCFEIPDIYIAEMILDWAAMGFKFGDNPYAYYHSKGYSKTLHPNTKIRIEEVLELLKPIFEEKTTKEENNDN